MSAEHELVIRPDDRVRWSDVADIWRYRELLWTLAMRDVRVRYKQAALGVAWALLQPLLQMAVFTVLFHRVAGISADVPVPYPLFCFAGLIVWTLFANGLSNASDSLVSNAQVVTKVYFPRIVLVLASVMTAVVDFAVGSVLLFVLVLYYRVPLHASLLWALPMALLAAFAAAAAGLWTSAINIQFRDVRHALPFFIQIMIYATPVFYSTSLLPVRYRTWLELNPLAAIVDGFRAAWFGTPLPLARVAMAAAVIVVVAATGFLFFRRMERTFADRV
ncbi:MAG TPA: ABC transporter permease [Polyangia bacterium]|jgi:lipopolysaccharide transport system permease protein